jgi:hypothetical protein
MWQDERMSIAEIDIKLLWGRAAARCSMPGCNDELTKYLLRTGDVTIGEMAHVISTSNVGPRGDSASGIDAYENLILLCPTHHTLIDKAPDDFPVDVLRDWKSRHEESVREATGAPAFASGSEFRRAIWEILEDNRTIHAQHGPESEEPHRRAMSEGADYWNRQKLSRVVPNNRRIISIVERNRRFLTDDEWGQFALFRRHAEAFEANAITRQMKAPVFPTSFAALFRASS